MKLNKKMKKIEQRDEIGVDVQIWLWVRVEFMAW